MNKLKLLFLYKNSLKINSQIQQNHRDTLKNKKGEKYVLIYFNVAENGLLLTSVFLALKTSEYLLCEILILFQF
jgi:hypothetical protein